MEKYPVTSRAFHWISALLIIGLFVLGVWMRGLDYYSSWYQTAPDIHKQIGVLVLLITLARIIWRIKQPAMPALANHLPWEKKLSHAIHMIMYICIIVILFSGYLISTADNRGIEILGLFHTPVLFEAFDGQEDIAGLIHEYVAYFLMACIGLHLAGALKHHVIDKDVTLKRML